MREAVIVASSRTPLAKSHRGSFNMTRPDDLAAHCIKDVLQKMPTLSLREVEEVVLGCGQPHQSQGHNVARVAALRAGLPVTTSAVTVNRFCNSGLQAIVQVAHMIVQEGVDVAIGGGVESITMVPRDNCPNSTVREQYPGLYIVMGETA
jgi:acetyl-CoA acyltransferase